jgi:hypothetical protein
VAGEQLPFFRAGRLHSSLGWLAGHVLMLSTSLTAQVQQPPEESAAPGAPGEERPSSRSHHTLSSPSSNAFHALFRHEAPWTVPVSTLPSACPHREDARSMEQGGWSPVRCQQTPWNCKGFGP